MQLSKAGIAFIKQNEGTEPNSHKYGVWHAYQDCVGVWTIYYGLTYIKLNDVVSKVNESTTLTDIEAECAFKESLSDFEECVNDLCQRDNVQLKQCEFDALVDFAFNLGCRALRNSCLWNYGVKCHNRERTIKEFGRWVIAGGKRNAGLVARRAREVSLFCGVQLMAVEGEVVVRKGKGKRYAHHVDLSEDEEVKALATKYEGTKGTSLQKIDEADLERILRRYEKDQTMDLYTIADAFDVSSHALYEALKSDKYAERYQAAKRRRGEMLVQKAIDIASAPWNMIQEGKQLSMVDVNAAKLYATTTLYAGKCLNPDYQPQKQDVAEGGINIVVQTGIKLNV